MDESERVTATLILRVMAEADPSALVRVLMPFQNLNIVPRCVSAELASTRVLHIRVELPGFAEERLTQIAAKLAEFPYVLRAYWHC